MQREKFWLKLTWGIGIPAERRSPQHLRRSIQLTRVSARIWSLIPIQAEEETKLAFVSKGIRLEEEALLLVVSWLSFPNFTCNHRCQTKHSSRHPAMDQKHSIKQQIFITLALVAVVRICFLFRNHSSNGPSSGPL